MVAHPYLSLQTLRMNEFPYYYEDIVSMLQKKRHEEDTFNSGKRGDVEEGKVLFRKTLMR